MIRWRSFSALSIRHKLLALGLLPLLLALPLLAVILVVSLTLNWLANRYGARIATDVPVP